MFVINKHSSPGMSRSRFFIACAVFHGYEGCAAAHLYFSSFFFCNWRKGWWSRLWTGEEMWIFCYQSIKHRKLVIFNWDQVSQGHRNTMGSFQPWYPEPEWRTRADILHFVLGKVLHDLLFVFVLWSEVWVETFFNPKWNHLSLNVEVVPSRQSLCQWGLFLKQVVWLFFLIWLEIEVLRY